MQEKKMRKLACEIHMLTLTVTIVASIVGGIVYHDSIIAGSTVTLGVFLMKVMIEKRKRIME